MSELRFQVVSSYGLGNTQAINTVKRISEIDTTIQANIFSRLKTLPKSFIII